jgi:hypothetical protein
MYDRPKLERDSWFTNKISRRSALQLGVAALGLAAIGLPPRVLRADGAKFLFDTSKPSLGCSDLGMTYADYQSNQIVQPLNKIYPRARFICFQGQDTNQIINGEYQVNGVNWDLDTNVNLMMQSVIDFYGHFFQSNYVLDDQFLPTTTDRIVQMSQPIEYYNNYTSIAFDNEVINHLNFASSFKSDGYNAYYGIVMPNSSGDPSSPFYYEAQSGPFYQKVNGTNYFLGFSCLGGQFLNLMVNNFQQSAYLAAVYETVHQFGYPDGHTNQGVPINEIYNYDTLYNGQLKYLDTPFNLTCQVLPVPTKTVTLTPAPTPVFNKRVFLPILSR